MQPENTGRLTIQNIIKKRKKFFLIIEGENDIEINEEVIAEHLLYIGKELDLKFLNEIVKSVNSSEAVRYMYGILARQSYTEKEIVDKLKKRQYEKSAIALAISKAKKVGLIDDKQYAMEYVEISKRKGRGPRVIKQDLIRKGISEVIITSLENEMSSKQEEVIDLINKLNKQFGKSNYKRKKQQIFESLSRKGFSSEETIGLIEDLILKDESQESDLLAIDFQKLKNKAEKKYHGKELREHIISKLLQKGYNYQDIIQYEEEQND